MFGVAFPRPMGDEGRRASRPLASMLSRPGTRCRLTTCRGLSLRRRIASEPFAIEQGTKHIEVTISIGLATLDTVDDNAATMHLARRA